MTKPVDWETTGKKSLFVLRSLTRKKREAVLSGALPGFGPVQSHSGAVENVYDSVVVNVRAQVPP